MSYDFDNGWVDLDSYYRCHGAYLKSRTSSYTLSQIHTNAAEFEREEIKDG
jgi:hypothetical protein